MKNIVITGASQGIGKAISKALSHKYNLIAIDIEMPEHHFCKHFFQCDLSDSVQLQSTIEAIQTKISSLYGLVNNAGIFTNKPLSGQSLEEWEKIFRAVWPPAEVWWPKGEQYKETYVGEIDMSIWFITDDCPAYAVWVDPEDGSLYWAG